MAYIGSQPTVGSIVKLNNISSGFNGSTTTFQLALLPGDASYYFTPGSAYQLIVSLNNVIKNPDVDYTVNGSQITFTTAPASGLSCFIIALGQSINVGTPGTGTVTTPSFGTLTSLPLTGATSGKTTIQAPAVAGNNTLTLPTSNGSAYQVIRNGATAGSLEYVDKIVSDTAKTYNWNGLTTNTSIDFTGIPSWVKRVTVMFNQVSTNGASMLLSQIGAGSIVTTGYISTNSYTGASAGGTTSTAGFILTTAAGAANTLSGHFVLTLVGSNIWAASCVIGRQDGYTNMGTGTVTLSGTLDRVRITTVNGTDTFDAGSINILYE
jgi:hypothetical protein